MSSQKKHDSGAAAGARRATEQAPQSSAGPGGGRWSAKRKVGSSNCFTPAEASMTRNGSRKNLVGWTIGTEAPN